MFKSILRLNIICNKKFIYIYLLSFKLNADNSLCNDSIIKSILRLIRIFSLHCFASTTKTMSADFGIASSSNVTNFPSGTVVPFTKLHLEQCRINIYVTCGHMKKIILIFINNSIYYFNQIFLINDLTRKLYKIKEAPTN